MNPIDDQMDRLFRAARKSAPAAAVPPFGLETRVLASWRSAREAATAGGWDMALLVRGLIVAIAIMGVTILPAWQKSADPVSEYLQLADSSLPQDDAP